MTINQIALECHQIATEHGFSDAKSIKETEVILAKLMLMVSELGEAAEAARIEDLANFIEELADTCIRIFATCASMQIDIETAILSKMEINRKRPYKHGKKY